MNMIVYQEVYELEESLDNFLDLLFSEQMGYFASDLLKNDLTPTEITDAVRKAMTAAKSAGLNLRRHFHLRYSDYRGALIKDCKLSRFAYALVLLNLDVRKPFVAKWQVKVLERFLAMRPNP